MVEPWVRIPPLPFTYDVRALRLESKSKITSVLPSSSLGSSPVGCAPVYREQIRISQQFRNKFPFSRTGIQSGTSWRKARRKIMDMELRFACPTCGQHLSAIPAQIGVTAPCPNCNAAVAVPMQSTLRPRLPDSMWVRFPPGTFT